MFRPRKRRLYTPITPPSDEENEENQSKAQEDKTKAENKQNDKKSSEKISITFATHVQQEIKPTFKISAEEMAENLEWKNMKMIFTKHPVLGAKSRVKYRLNSVTTANKMASKNYRDGTIENKDTSTLLDVIARKLLKDRVNEVPKEHNEVPPPLTSTVNCELLKSVFTDYEINEKSIEEEELEVDGEGSNKLKQGFISSHIISAAATTELLKTVGSEADVKETTEKKPVTKSLISKEIYDEWLTAPSTFSAATSRAALSSSSVRQNPKDLGIFPEAPSLTKSSKKIFHKELNLDSLLQ